MNLSIILVFIAEILTSIRVPEIRSKTRIRAYMIFDI